MHYVGGGRAVALSVPNAQIPGIQILATSLFGSPSFIRENILERSFAISPKMVDDIRVALVPGCNPDHLHPSHHEVSTPHQHTKHDSEDNVAAEIVVERN